MTAMIFVTRYFFFVGLAFCIVFAGRAYFANFAVSFWAVKSMLHNLSTGTVDCDCHRIVFNALKLLASTRVWRQRRKVCKPRFVLWLSIVAQKLTYFSLQSSVWALANAHRHYVFMFRLRRRRSHSREAKLSLRPPKTYWSVRVMPRVSSNCRRWDVNVTKSQLWPTYGRSTRRLLSPLPLAMQNIVSVFVSPRCVCVINGNIEFNFNLNLTL